MVPVFELVLTALAVYALASRLGGWAGGLLAAGMWVFDPFVTGIGHVDGIDLPGTQTALLLALATVRWTETRTRLASSPSVWPAARRSSCAIPDRSCWRRRCSP